MPVIISDSSASRFNTAPVTGMRDMNSPTLNGDRNGDITREMPLKNIIPYCFLWNYRNIPINRSRILSRFLPLRTAGILYT